MIKRVALIAGAGVAAVMVVGGLALWAWLSAWVPVTGKARLIQELEGKFPVEVSIGSMRYEPLRGFVLSAVRVVERGTEEVWGDAPAMQARLNWLALLLARRLRFRGRATLEAPCQTELAFSGRYHLGTRSLILNAQTAELPVRSLSGPLKPHVPSSLVDGVVRLTLHLTKAPQTLPTVTARINGTGLVWQADSWRFVGDVLVNGTANPPKPEGGRWALNGVASLTRATVDGVPGAGTITELEGAARFLPDRIEIEALTGTMLGSPWTLEGTLTLQPLALEALATSRAQLSPVASAVPRLAALWRPDGIADLRAVCRGPLAPSPLLDCRAVAEVDGVTLASSKLSEPLTVIAGRVAYDLLARRVTIDHLTGRLKDHPLAVSGEIRLADPLELALHLDGEVPLETLTPWLSAGAAVSALEGLAALDVELTGSTAAAQLAGELKLREVAVRFVRPQIRLEGLTGSVRFSPERIDIPEATLRLNDEPLTLRAAMMPPAGGLELVPLNLPRLSATVEFPQGRLQLAGRLTPQDLAIDGARVDLAGSSVELRGALARTPDHPSMLDLSGTVRFEELGDLPLVSLPALTAWNVKGTAEVDAQFQGELSDWRSATIRSQLRTRALAVRHLPLEQLVCTVEQHERVLRLRIPSGLLAGGKLTGELIVDHRPNTLGYVAQADLIGMDLAALAQAIPAWRSRSLEGRASAHALLSGKWGKRAAWQGEGWLNASGQRLGDLPLLENVFRGLFGVLADRLGLEMLRRAQITEASVRWRLAQERFTTEDLRLGGVVGIEPIAIYAKGSVGFDQTLDFVIKPELSEVAVLQAPTTASLASTVLKAAGQLDRLRRLIGRHRITGTLKDPVYRFEFSTQEVFRQLAPGPVDFLQDLFEAVR